MKAEEQKIKYPECTCGEDHYYYVCHCESHSFYVNARKKLICAECHSSIDISKVLSMIKKNEH